MQDQFAAAGTTVPDEEQTLRYIRQLLLDAKRDLDIDTIRVIDYRTEDLTDLSCTVDPGELLGKGRLSYWHETLDGRQSRCRHSFEIREQGTDTLQVRITDHANILG